MEAFAKEGEILLKLIPPHRIWDHLDGSCRISCPCFAEHLASADRMMEIYVLANMSEVNCLSSVSELFAEVNVSLPVGPGNMNLHWKGKASGGGVYAT